MRHFRARSSGRLVGTVLTNIGFRAKVAGVKGASQRLVRSYFRLNGIMRMSVLRLPVAVSLFALLGSLAWTDAKADSPPSRDPIVDLNALSLEELGNIQITSVSKKAELLSDAPAAIYVITHDDIIRSGAATIPEMLRLAPNLQVAQINPNSYAISARGFNGQIADKLLVLIDGRSVYTPIFAGVYWDMQYVAPESIERIEVISGPGGTLWGANAVNGVINIITRRSGDTQGGVLTVGAGNRGYQAGLQYGGKFGSDLSYRVYAAGYSNFSDKTANGFSAQDGWSKPQGGFRLDWSPDKDLVTAQADIYAGNEEQLAATTQSISGGDLLTRWTHSFDNGSSLQVQAYYDHEGRFVSNSGGGDELTTYDLDVQHNFAVTDWNAIVWGGGYRLDLYRVFNELGLVFVPGTGTLRYANLFAEDTITISDRVKLVAGIKLEDDAYVGAALLPSLRVSWKVSGTDLLWAAVSRAVRSPTPFDRDAQGGGPPPLLIGGADFQSEKLTAYEIGYRGQPMSALSFSVSAYYNDYTSLRSIDFTPTFFPVAFANFASGNTYGVEVWGNYKFTNWWRLSASFNIQHENLTYDVPLTPGFLGPYEAPYVPLIVNQIIGYTGDDSTHQISLRSSMDLDHDVAWDAELRKVGALPNPAVPGYVELDMRAGWQVTNAFRVSLIGSNLLHAHHVEFVESATAVEIPRSLTLEVQHRF